MSKFFKYITTPVKQMKEWFSQNNSDNTQIQFNEYYSGQLLTLAMKVNDQTFQMSEVNNKIDLLNFVSQFNDDDEITFYNSDTKTIYVTESMRLPENGTDIVLMLEELDDHM